MTEKRPVGRPRKYPVAEQKNENPDCEPATKGFVKYLMRKYDTHHTHLQTGVCGFSFIVSMALAFAWSVLLIYHFDGVYVWMTGLLSLVALASVLDTDGIGSKKTDVPTGDGLFDEPPKYLREYKPPTREKKKECE